MSRLLKTLALDGQSRFPRCVSEHKEWNMRIVESFLGSTFSGSDHYVKELNLEKGFPCTGWRLFMVNYIGHIQSLSQRINFMVEVKRPSRQNQHWGCNGFLLSTHRCTILEKFLCFSYNKPIQLQIKLLHSQVVIEATCVQWSPQSTSSLGPQKTTGLTKFTLGGTSNLNRFGSKVQTPTYI